MDQGTIDNLSSPFILTIVALVFALLANSFLFKFNGQKIYINSPNLTLDTDTIFLEKSRWYYPADSSNRDLKVSIYKENGGRPYDEFYLEPDDYIDLELLPGYNIVHLRTLGKYPTTHTRSRILQLRTTKKPKSNLFKDLLNDWN